MAGINVSQETLTNCLQKNNNKISHRSTHDNSPKL